MSTADVAAAAWDAYNYRTDLRNLSAYSQRGVLTAHGPMLAFNWLQKMMMMNDAMMSNCNCRL